MRRSTLFDAFSSASHTQFFTLFAVILRLALGVVFFGAGLSKLTMEGGWSASGYLLNATGPFADVFISMAGNPFVDQLNMWGLTLIGLALLLGLFVRTASVCAILLMILYYLADFEGSTAHGWIDYHIIYSVVFAMFLAGGFGHMWGLDGLLERRLSHKQQWLKIFLG